MNGTSDALPGYESTSIEITDEVFLAKGEQSVQLTATPTPDGKIDGTVFEVSSEELARSDKYEPTEYSRVEVTLDSGMKAWIYLKI